MNNLIAKGKTKESNRWIEGNLVLDNESNPVIIESLKKEYGICDSDGIVRFSEVHKDSVALKTGLQDKNNNDIWGGVKINNKMTKGGSILKANPKNTITSVGTAIYQVLWRIDHWHINNTRFTLQELFNYYKNNVEIIGNNYNDPELLGKQ